MNIVFFDGVCHLCNAFVDFLIQKETEGRLVFAPLQGENAKKYLSENDRVQLQTVVVYNLKSGEILRESTAIFRALSKVPGGLGKLAGLGAKFPLNVRDLIYRIVAKNRYSLFGQKESCRIPQASERTRLWN